MREEHLRRLAQLDRERRDALAMGGEKAVERQHQRGKLTCRERIDLLLDPGSFHEYGMLAQSVVEVPGKDPRVARAGGVVIGAGTIEGRRVLVLADDATVASGARGAAGGRKSGHLLQMAKRLHLPLISLLEASAGRVQDMMGSKAWAGLGFDAHTTGFGGMVDLSGLVPRVAAARGKSVGGAAFNAMLSDFVLMVKGTSFMAVSGPPVILGAVGEKVTTQELGGADVHLVETGQADFGAEDDAHCMQVIREYLSYFPSNCFELPPHRPTEDPFDRKCERLLDVVPTNQRRPYDMHEVIQEIVDERHCLPLKADYGQAIITCLARMGGHPVGIVASQPLHMAGVLDDTAAYKAIHFMDLCDAFHVPLVFLVDCPGFIVGKDWERRSMLKTVARALHVHRRITVPKLTIVVRKAYGLAYWILGGKAMNPDTIAAWPTASFSLMAPEPALNVLYEQEIKAAPDPERKRAELMELFAHEYAPEGAAHEAILEDVIDPRDTRSFLCRSLEVLLNAQRYTAGFRHPIWP
jgi:acetyl-CoA carboxylase carboxyltransferase component